jgi:hypothetical protein
LKEKIYRDGSRQQSYSCLLMELLKERKKGKGFKRQNRKGIGE